MSALVILSAVFILIAVRQAGRFNFHIWQIMPFGAAAVLTGAISATDALRAINLDVMLFLSGMFVVGAADRSERACLLAVFEVDGVSANAGLHISFVRQPDARLMHRA